MAMPYHEAHKRLGEIHKELGKLPVGQPAQATALMDEAVHCITSMSSWLEIRYPLEVTKLRVAQMERAQEDTSTGPGAA